MINFWQPPQLSSLKTLAVVPPASPKSPLEQIAEARRLGMTPEQYAAALGQQAAPPAQRATPLNPFANTPLPAGVESAYNAQQAASGPQMAALPDEGTAGVAAPSIAPPVSQDYLAAQAAANARAMKGGAPADAAASVASRKAGLYAADFHPATADAAARASKYTPNATAEEFTTTPTTDPLTDATYSQVLGGFLTGSAYDPYAQAASEGNARAAQNLRGSTATTAARLGLTGQGAGAQMANATTQQIMGQTLDTNLGIAKGRTEMQAGAMPEYRANRGETWGEARSLRDEGRTDAEKAFDWAMEYGSDSDVIAAAAQRGVTLDPASVATYRNESRMARQGTVTSAIESDFAGYAMAHPTADWRGDPGAIQKGSALYQAYTGKTADPNSPDFQTFMDNQWKSAQYEGPNEIDAAINSVKDSEWYQALPKDSMSAPPGYAGMTQADANELAALTVFGGYSVNHNADGSISILDPSGAPITNQGNYTTTSGTGTQTQTGGTQTGTAAVPVINRAPVKTIAGTNESIKSMTDGGLDYEPSVDRVGQFFDQFKRYPTDADEFRAWDKSTYRAERITAALSGEDGSTVDDLIPQDWTAIRTALSGNYPEEDSGKYDPILKALGKPTVMEPTAATTIQPGDAPPAANTGAVWGNYGYAAVSSDYDHLGGGEWNEVLAVDKSVYELGTAQKGEGSFGGTYYESPKFNTAFRSKVEGLKGKPITINGQTYIVDSDSPVVQQSIGMIGGKLDMQADGIKVTDMNGTSKIITFPVYAATWDDNPNDAANAANHIQLGVKIWDANEVPLI